jgi:hypothetical protein
MLFGSFIDKLLASNGAPDLFDDKVNPVYLSKKRELESTSSEIGVESPYKVKKEAFAEFLL